MRTASIYALFIIATLVYVSVAIVVFGQTTPPIQPQQFRFQTPPPALDIRPDYEAKPCR